MTKRQILPLPGPRATLRLVTRVDLPRTLAWRNKNRVRAAFIHSSELSADEHGQWFDAYAERDDDFVFLIEERDSGRPVGQVSLYGIDWTAGTATFGRLLIGEDDALGQGFASEATRLVLSYARRVGLREIRLEVFKGNGRAIGLYRRHGFEPRGAEGDLLLMKRRVRQKHSVIVGSYNRPKLVGQAIASVLEQTVQDWELIVSDDGSNDETLSAIRELTDRDPRCRLLTVEHLDDSLPRPDCHRRAVRRINDAIKVLAGDVVHYLADDDLFDVTRFEIFDELFSNPDVVVGYGRLVYVDAAGHPTGETRYFESIGDPLYALDQNQVAHRRLVFDRVPAWAEVDHYASDGEFFRAMRSVWPFCGIDRVVGYKRLHGLNMQTTKDQSTGSRE
jgi:RimJ/RimL family protein N-acetyltransferase